MALLAELGIVILLGILLLMVYMNDRALSRKRVPKAVIEEWWDGPERRKYRRFQTALEISYRIKPGGHGEAVGMTVDISAGGMKILLYEKLSAGTHLDMQADLPGIAKHVQLEGEVAWSGDAGEEPASGKRSFYAGVKFSSLKEPARTMLINYINSIASENVST
jgi:c-di-GMP-binding flagellar brake protein YcgR